MKIKSLNIYSHPPIPYQSKTKQALAPSTTIKFGSQTNSEARPWEQMSLKEKMRHNWQKSSKTDFLTSMIAASGATITATFTPLTLIMIPLALLCVGAAFFPVIKALFNKKESGS